MPYPHRVSCIYGWPSWLRCHEYLISPAVLAFAAEERQWRTDTPAERERLAADLAVRLGAVTDSQSDLHDVAPLQTVARWAAWSDIT
jgi:hypothetical protein